MSQATVEQAVPTLEHLAARYQQTRADADFEALANRCRGLLVFVAKRVAGRWQNVQPDPDDVEAAARVGLFLAAARYRPDRGASFLTFAFECIRGQVGGVFRKQAIGNRRTISLQMNYGEDGTLLDTIADASTDEPAADPDRQDLAERLHALIGRHCLRREAAVLRLRYLEGLTLDDVGQRLGVSKERIRQIAGVGLERLRRAITDPATLDVDRKALDLSAVELGPESRREISRMLKRYRSLPPAFDRWVRARFGSQAMPGGPGAAGSADNVDGPFAGGLAGDRQAVPVLGRLAGVLAPAGQETRLRGSRWMQQRKPTSR